MAGDAVCRTRAREAPVLAEADVVVVGGGFGGVCAAAGAARAGAAVALIERDGMLGGQAAEVYTFGLDAVVDNNGRQIIRGLPWEIIRRTIAEGQSDPVWEKVDFARMQRDGVKAEMERLGTSYQYKSHQYLDPHAFRYVLHTLMEEEGVTVFLESPLVDVVLEGNRVVGVVAQGNYGPFALRGKALVDTTPHAAVAALAGHPFPYPEVYLGTHPRVAGVDIERLLDYVADNPGEVEVAAVASQEPGFLRSLVENDVSLLMHGFRQARARAVAADPAYECTGRGEDRWLTFFYEREGLGSYWIHPPQWDRSRLDDPLHMSRVVAAFRRNQWLTHKLFRDFVPGFERAHLVDVHPHVARALVRSNEPGTFTEQPIPWEHIEKDTPLAEQSVARVMGHPDAGQAPGGWQLPYLSLIPRGLEGLLVTGKPASRVIHYHGTVAAVGHAAGVAAAVAARLGSPLREVPVQAVQEELQRQDAVVF